VAQTSTTKEGTDKTTAAGGATRLSKTSGFSRRHFVGAVAAQLDLFGFNRRPRAIGQPTRS
jgi:hypothetical protein